MKNVVNSFWIHFKLHRSIRGVHDQDFGFHVFLQQDWIRIHIFTPVPDQDRVPNFQSIEVTFCLDSAGFYIAPQFRESVIANFCALPVYIIRKVPTTGAVDDQSSKVLFIQILTYYHQSRKQNPDWIRISFYQTGLDLDSDKNMIHTSLPWMQCVDKELTSASCHWRPVALNVSLRSALLAIIKRLETLKKRLRVKCNRRESRHGRM